MNYRTTTHRCVEVDGAQYVYVTGSAAVLRLDEVSARLLGQFDVEGGAAPASCLPAGASEEVVQDVRRTFEEMVAMGLIRPVGEVTPPTPALPPMPYPLATLVLNVTNKCNLSCTYCYEFGEDRIADEATASGKARTPMMSPETARQSVDFLFRSSPNRRELTITFFGGETLLNFDTIRATAEYAAERARSEGKVVGFSLTTNATLLTDEVIDFLTTWRFGINVSIDGVADDHDRHRVFKSGKGSYEQILPRIRKLIAKNKPRGRPIGARVTLTAGMRRLRDTYDHLTREIGFDEVGFAPVTSAPGRDYALSDTNYQQILDEFTELAEDYVSEAVAGRLHGFSNMNDIVRELHLGLNKAHPCGAGLGLLGVSTEGDLGLCHRFVESGEHEVGNVRDGVDEAKRQEFLEKGHVDEKIACHECFARPLCSGGCYHEAYVRYRDPTKPNLHYCDWIRAWTDLGLRTYGRIVNENPAFMERFEATA